MAKHEQTAPDTLVITYSDDDGSTGKDNDPNNPLARALNSLLTTGRPIGRFSACYLNPLPMANGIRWFGTFVYSDGDRVIYFPGFAEKQQYVQTSKGTSSIKQQAFEVDHLSLQSHWRDWHLTTKASTHHIGSYPTTDLGEGRVLWFGMSIAAPHVLRPLLAQTEVAAHIHPNDTLRRASIFTEARDGVVFNILMFNAKTRLVPCFAHFTVIVGPCGFPDYSGEQLALPFGSPFISGKLPDVLTDIPCRSHRVSLEPHVDLQIITTGLPGAITVPAIFICPEN